MTVANRNTIDMEGNTMAMATETMTVMRVSSTVNTNITRNIMAIRNNTDA